MSKLTLVTISVIGLIMMMTGLGCVALSSYLTPADIDPTAVKYVTDTGVSEKGKYAGYPNLYKAELLKEDVEKAYKLNQFELQKAAEKNDLDYSICKDASVARYTEAIEREEALFGTTGLLSTGLTAAGFGMFTGLLGLARKRPGDITSQEMNAAIAQATGETEETIAAKTKQFTEVVKSVEKFKGILDNTANSSSNTEVKVADLILQLKKDMKDIFNSTQDTDTQVAVATTLKQTA